MSSSLTSMHGLLSQTFFMSSLLIFLIKVQLELFDLQYGPTERRRQRNLGGFVLLF